MPYHRLNCPWLPNAWALSLANGEADGLCSSAKSALQRTCSSAGMYDPHVNQLVAGPLEMPLQDHVPRMCRMLTPLCLATVIRPIFGLPTNLSFQNFAFTQQQPHTMYTRSPTGAMLVDAHTAIAIMDYVLHGSILAQAPKPFVARRCPLTRKRTLVTPRLPSYPCPLDSVVLRKPAARPTPAPLPQVTVPPRFRRRFTVRSSCADTFYPGFCYLAAVDTTDRIEACLALGDFPTVSALARSDIVCCNSAYLTVQCPGLYHLSTRPTGIPLLSGNRAWVVGAKLPPRPTPNPFARPAGPASNNGNPFSSPPRGYGPRGPRGGRGSCGNHPPPGHSDRYFPADSSARPGPMGPPDNGYQRKRKNPAQLIFQPYSTDVNRRRAGSPSATAQAWKSATRDELDITINGLRTSLTNLPKSRADPVWNDFLVWLQEYKRAPDFSRDAAVAAAQAQFASLYSPALAAVQEETKALDSLEARALELNKLAALISKLEEDIANPPPGADPNALDAELKDVQTRYIELDAEINFMDAEAPPPTEMDDAFAHQENFIPLEENPVQPWVEANYKRFEERTSPLFKAPTGKIPLADLHIEMETSPDSKILLPRPLELYTEDEINHAHPKGCAPWFNRFDDPMEPVKSWSKDVFDRVYEKPGFHFMITRVAQMGPQVRDPKLATLCSKLSARWDCQVEFSAMDPRQDWMWCTIPDISSPRKEVLTTALMRLSDGNASYIVWHFGQPSLTRDLTFTVKGQSGDADAVYAQLRKRLLEFEARGIFLGWRVLGVRHSNAPFQFCTTFLLDRPSVAWPWQMLHGHVHRSVNPQLPLLNFNPPWQAKKPYACQACYSSIHPSHECPLVSIRLGGVAIVSHISIMAVLTKKAAERLIIVDCLLVPKKLAQPANVPEPPAVNKGKAKAPLSIVSEGSVLARPDSVSMFLTNKLHQVVNQGLLSEEDIVAASADGSLTRAFKTLSRKLPLLSKISLDDVLVEFDKWEALAVLPASIAERSDHSMRGSEAPSDVVPSSKTPPFLPSEFRPLGRFPEMEDESQHCSYVAQAPAAINDASGTPGVLPGGASNPAPPQPLPSELCLLPPYPCLLNTYRYAL